MSADRARRRAARPGPSARLRVPDDRPDHARQRPARDRHADAGARADRRVAGDPRRRGRRARRARRRDGPRGPGPDRGHGGPRRDRAHRGRRAARRLAPRRGRLGRDVRRASTCPASRLTPALELLAEVAPPARVPRARGRPPARRAPDRPAAGEGRPAAARRGGVRRRDLRARRAPTTGRPAAPRTTVERPDAPPSSGRSTTAGFDPAPRRDRRRRRRRSRRRGPRCRRPCSATGPADPTAATPGPIDDTSAVTGRFVQRRPPARARSRPRSASATRRCPAATPTSTPCR